LRITIIEGDGFILLKKVSVLVAVCLLMGSFTVISGVQAAASTVGYVDFMYLVNHHPDTAKANEELKAVQEAAKQEFADKSSGMNDHDKQVLDHELGQRLEQKRQALLKPIADKVVSAANEVAKEKGLTIVIGNRDVVCGGVDITADVLKKITDK